MLFAIGVFRRQNMSRHSSDLLSRWLLAKNCTFSSGQYRPPPQLLLLLLSAKRIGMTGAEVCSVQYYVPQQQVASSRPDLALLLQPVQQQHCCTPHWPRRPCSCIRPPAGRAVDARGPRPAVAAPTDGCWPPPPGDLTDVTLACRDSRAIYGHSNSSASRSQSV